MERDRDPKGRLFLKTSFFCRIETIFDSITQKAIIELKPFFLFHYPGVSLDNLVGHMGPEERSVENANGNRSLKTDFRAPPIRSSKTVFQRMFFWVHVQGLSENLSTLAPGFLNIIPKIYVHELRAWSVSRWDVL